MTRCRRTPRDALHEKHAKTALDFALAHRGVYIKAGQFIASLQGGAGERAIPSAYVRTLQKLTDDAPTVPLADVAAVFEADMGPLAWSFDSVDELPVAAGSLAQVHRALRTQADAELFDGINDEDSPMGALATLRSSSIPRTRRASGGRSRGAADDGGDDDHGRGLAARRHHAAHHDRARLSH